VLRAEHTIVGVEDHLSPRAWQLTSLLGISVSLSVKGTELPSQANWHDSTWSAFHS
jgi:hypothetical protein